MTYEEFKNKFPIGSKVIVKYMDEEDFYGKIIVYDDLASFVLVNWGSNKRGLSEYSCYWYNTSEAILSDLELVSEVETKSSIQENKLCPRCSNEMVKKQSDQYGLIDKCSNCGYC